MTLRLTDVWRGRSDTCDRLYHGDNLAVMSALLPRFAGQVSLIYLDPPFLARQVFRREVEIGGERIEAEAYSDVWSGGLAEYLLALRERLALVRELLATDGSLFVHVNWRVSPYVQMLLDEIIGAGEREGPGRAGFRNEIVWGFGGGGNVRNAYRRKHDNLFWYTKSRKWRFRPQFRPYSAGTKERGLTAVKGPNYELRDEGASLETWWTDSSVQKILSPTAFENLKYPTQKPESLLERIIEGHSDPGDLVADFYCGSGTTPAVAARLGRRWLACDTGRLAVAVSWQRLVGVHQTLSVESAATPGVALYRLRSSGDLSSAGSAKATCRAHGESAIVTLRDYQSEAAPDAGIDAVDYWAVDLREPLQVGEGRLRPQPGTTLVETVRPQVRSALLEESSDWATDMDEGTFSHDLFACRSAAEKRNLPLELSTRDSVGGTPRVRLFDCFGNTTTIEATPE